MWLLWCAFLLCVCAWWRNLSQRWRRLLGDLPTFSQLPLIGNIHHLSNDPRKIYKMFDKIANICDETEKPFVIWFGPQPVIFVSDPEDAQAVNNTFVGKPYYYRFAKIWLGDGLVIAPSEVWKQNIKKLGGTLNRGIVEGYQEVFVNRAADLVGRLKARANDEPFDMLYDLTSTSLEAICQTALGFPKISECIVTKEYHFSFHRSLELLIQRGFNPLYHPDNIYYLTPAFKEWKKCIDVLHNVSHTVIEKRTLEREEAKKENKINEFNGKSRFKSFLDLLLEMQDKDPSITEETIQNEVESLVIGGHETIALTLFHTFLMLGRYKNLQDKLYNEVRDVLGDDIRPVCVEDLPRLEYCEAVILETLRVFPPFPVVLRQADKDLPLNSGKCVIPRGAMCAVSALVMSRARRYWGADAALYRPERWLTHRPAPPAAFLAFSYGRRACIGKNYAMAIIKTLLVSCVREVEFTAEDTELELKADLVLRPSSGHLLKVQIR